MSIQPSLATTTITPVKVAGFWCIVKYEPPKSTTFYSVHNDFKSAEFVGKQLANTANLPFTTYQLLLDKPVISIRKYDKVWQIVKIFHDAIENNTTFPEKTKALDEAEKLAKKENLDFLPNLGSVIFKV